ncbi:MAG: ATP-binding protein [Chitinispirillales bacterium]|jgi:hypothetical protein|nr:ATP-binding protein [Chitinispirillales bacterium]
MKQLSTGIQVFETIRKRNALYVDKTDVIYELVSGSMIQYFLSRPRRFGKSLLCWTLDALFSGKRELFEGLAISKTDWEWESYPVIHLDMSMVSTNAGISGVMETLIWQTKKIAEEYGINLDGLTVPGIMLANIIVEVSKKNNKPIVVIVDEYDKPFLDFYNKPPTAQEVRDIMRDYYTQLKANERHIRFLFMTGISKFTKAGVFSTLNNLNDISLDRKFGTLLGYTEKELIDYFQEHLEAAALDLNTSTDELVDRLRTYYNGFCFDGIHKVYCPFSVLSFFGDNSLSNYWIDSGGTKIIADYMKDRRLTVEQFRGIQVSRDFARRPGEIETASPESFLYQTGYLTLREGISGDFSLDYPNTEVLNSMSELVYKNILQSNGEYIDLCAPLQRALFEGNGKLLVDTIDNLLASIPYDDYTAAAKQGLAHTGLDLSIQEWLYRSNILTFLRGCNVLAFGELHGSKGRSDLQIMHKGIPWVIEIKVARNDDCAAKAAEAMKQMNDNQYADPYKNARKLGIAIDDKTRRVGEWVEG